MKLYKKVPLYLRVIPVYVIIAAAFTYPLFATNTQDSGSSPSEYSVHIPEEITSTQAETAPRIEGSPKRIVISSVGIDVEIVRGSYDYSADIWSITDNTANYAVTTALPNNEKDKTFIYGHWSDDVFGPTNKLKPGEKADIYTDNGHKMTYVYTRKTNIKPTNVEILNTLSGTPGIVLMTCDGPFAEERRIMYFELVEYV